MAGLQFERLEDRRLLATGVLTATSNTDIAIPDNGGFSNKAVSSMVLSGAPSNAVVTAVEVEYWIDHTWVSNLKAYLTTQRGSTWYDHLYLWNQEGGSGDNIHETESGLGTWNGLNPNGDWYLVAGDFVAGEVGQIDAWRITVSWVAPDPLPSLNTGRIAWHSYTDYGALDGRIHVFDFDTQTSYLRATNTIAVAVTHAHNPNFSADGRYLTFMGLPAGSSYGANWRQYLDVFLYDFVTDRVTNLSAQVNLSVLGQIEEDAVLSPDALKVVFKRNVADLWEADVFGTALRQVTSGAGEKSGPQYAPDGNTLVFWVGDGSSSHLATVPAHNTTPTAPTPLHDNPAIQDYFPSFWGAERVLYTSWSSTTEHDDDIKVYNVTTQADTFALFNSASAEDSDPFGIDPSIVGFSTTRSTGKWELWYGDPTTGAAASLDISQAGKHNLGAKYTPMQVDYVEPSADFNSDGAVNGGDFLDWQRGYGTPAPTADKQDGDADNDLDVDGNDLSVWQTQYRTSGIHANVVARTSFALFAMSSNVSFESVCFLATGDGETWEGTSQDSEPQQLQHSLAGEDPDAQDTGRDRFFDTLGETPPLESSHYRVMQDDDHSDDSAVDWCKRRLKSVSLGMKEDAIATPGLRQRMKVFLPVQNS
jgi:subtilisin-like proprotein convertase family protein